MTDTIKRYTKSKGYESLPRELLQSKKLSLGAIGLICNMISYSEEWVLHKTELRNRFRDTSKMVDKFWDELVELGYIIQFRKRVGKSYEYSYFINDHPFNLKETQELLTSLFEDGFTLYHKKMLGNKIDSILPYLKCENKEALDLTIFESNFGVVDLDNPKKHDNINDSWGCRFEQPQMDNPNWASPNRQANKLINNKINYKQKDDDDILLRESKSKMVNDLLNQDERLKDTAKYLFGSGLNWDTVQDIIIHLEDREELLIPELITKQYEWCIVKQRTTGINDFAKYFVKGLEDKAKNINAEINPDIRDAYTRKYDSYKDIQIPLVELNYGT